MKPRIETIPEKKLIGKRLDMSITADRTLELWRGFMPERNLIQNRVSGDLLCLQIYDKTLDFKDFSPTTEYEKWAVAEVSNFDNIPDGMEVFVLTGGMYAVFLYKGDPRAYAPTFQYIYYTWLPSSDYELDNSRAHFDLLGEKYKNNDPESEEEIWVPIKTK